MAEVPGHEQRVTHRYRMRYPAHDPRAEDPHYIDFEHYRRKNRATARCFVGLRIGFQDCRDAQGHHCPPPDDDAEQPGLELHHAVIEDALVNGVDLAALDVDYPGLSDPWHVGEWAQSGKNLRWLCSWHHRGAAGAHTASHSDWTAGLYVPGLISNPRETP